MKNTWLFYIILSITLLVACNSDDKQQSINKPVNETSEFTPKGVPPGSESDYDISLRMDDELFTVNASIKIKNISEEEWDKLIFYFVPNMFTVENAPSLTNPSIIDIKEITVDQENVDYKLEKDTLELLLTSNIIPEGKAVVDISYSFTLPEDGLRFTKNGTSFYLAQWYPMVPTYRNGWNKEEFEFKGESYHTTYSDFQIEYEVPGHYTVITSSEEDKFPSDNKNTINLGQVKEVFIAILDDPTMIENKVGGTNLRVFDLKAHPKDDEEILEIASAAFNFFQTHIGPYPYKQLDIILEELGMEYPGIVTAGSIYNKTTNPEAMERIVVHEIAHQWFYGMVSNDPYHDPWLDEGITEFATFLFFSEYNDIDFDFEEEAKYYEDRKLTLPVNLSINEYPPKDRSSYIYGKSYMKLGQLFQENGGMDRAKHFLKSYFELYQFKEVNTEEFIRYLKYYLEIKDNAVFESWINMN